MAERTWTCQRQTNGVKCRAVNPKRRHICAACGKRRPKTKRPAHMAALDEFDYLQWVAEHGEVCAICGAEPKDGRRLARDHEHKGDGYVRGLLCFQCNRKLGNKNAEWLQAAADYLKRAASLRGDFPHPAQSAGEPCRNL